MPPFRHAGAYEIFSDARWDDACFTHDGSPEIVASLAKAAAVAGVRDCGVSDHPEIWLGGRPSPKNRGEAHHAYAANGPYVSCEIRLADGMESPGRDYVVLHEFGHCLGLGHSQVLPSVMAYDPMQPTEWQPDDIRGLQELYGQRAPIVIRYRASVVVVAR